MGEERIMKTNTMQDLGMMNDVNLCDSCSNQQPECDPNSVIFGTGIGDDNIAACDIYDPVEVRNFVAERNYMING